MARLPHVSQDTKIKPDKSRVEFMAERIGFEPHYFQMAVFCAFYVPGYLLVLEIVSLFVSVSSSNRVYHYVKNK